MYGFHQREPQPLYIAPGHIHGHIHAGRPEDPEEGRPEEGR
jgi:hypothetical protein